MVEEQVVENFNNIEYEPLRVWNRCVVSFNILESSGEEACKEYMRQFSDIDKAKMFDMMETVKIYGAENVKKDIMKSMPLQENEEEQIDG